MYPTLKVGDFLVVNKFAYGVNLPITNTELFKSQEPERGDVVVFLFPPQQHTKYIKRVIGKGGDLVTYHNKTLTVARDCGNGLLCPIDTFRVANDIEPDSQFVIDSVKLDGITHSIATDAQLSGDRNQTFHQVGSERGEWRVPKDHFFVMGDNRDGSTDSRFWGFVPKSHILGKVSHIWLSLEFQGNDTFPSGVRLERIGGINKPPKS